MVRLAGGHSHIPLHLPRRPYPVSESLGRLGESFFATLECELLDRRRFRIQAKTKMAIFQFIEG
jgi:hypothetical protein